MPWREYPHCVLIGTDIFTILDKATEGQRTAVLRQIRRQRSRSIGDA
jgi:hypothetical protein